MLGTVLSPSLRRFYNRYHIMPGRDLKRLVWGYLNKTLSIQEQDEWRACMIDTRNEEEIKQLLAQWIDGQGDLPGKLPDDVSEQLLNTILSGKPAEQALMHKTRIRMYGRWMVAAALLIFTLTVGWMLGYRYFSGDLSLRKRIAAQHTAKNPVFTFFNGHKVVLDDAVDSISLVVRNNKEILMINGREWDRQTVPDAGVQHALNTISTPPGKKLFVKLPDNSFIWLNAATTLRYITGLNDRYRQVYLEGEAYFNVSARPGAAFFVSAPRGMSVQVLGTSFNISAYADDPAVTTTLVSGKVKLKLKTESVTMSPGEQVVYKEGDAYKRAMLTDLAAVTAWKEGVFSMKNVDVQALARQIQRWYGIEVMVQQEDKFHSVSLGGALRFGTPLPDLMAALEYHGVKAILKNQKLILYPAKAGADLPGDSVGP